MSKILAYTKTYSTEIPDLFIKISVTEDGLYLEDTFREKTNEIRPYIEDCPFVKKIRQQVMDGVKKGTFKFL